MSRYDTNPEPGYEPSGRKGSDIDDRYIVARSHPPREEGNIALLREMTARRLVTVVEALKAPHETWDEAIKRPAINEMVGILFGIGHTANLPPRQKRQESVSLRLSRPVAAPKAPKVKVVPRPDLRRAVSRCGTLLGWVRHAEDRNAPCDRCAAARTKILPRGHYYHERQLQKGVDLAYALTAADGDSDAARRLNDDERLIAAVWLLVDRKATRHGLCKTLCMNTTLGARWREIILAELGVAIERKAA